MKKSDCIFCKLANGEIPARTIYEDELFRVILDASPATRGHALILPKEHYKDLFDLGEKEKAALMEVSQKVALKMKEKLKFDGLNLVQNNGQLAGQTVFHFHLHLIPRYNNEENQEKISWEHLVMKPEELDQICELFN